MIDTYSFWIAGNPTNVNYLCDKSFKKYGHKLIIYSYIDLKGFNAEIRDAREILSEKEIYFYKYFPESMKFGGIAERLKAEMLYKLGGLHIDLDVVALQSLDFKEDYVLRPHPKGVVANIIKAPKESELARQYIDWVKTITSENTDWEKSFLGLINIIKNLDLDKFIINKEILGTDEEKYWRDYLYNNQILPNPTMRAIHFCGSSSYYRNYEKGSFFEKLLKDYELI
jgi:hypothetical protein